MNVGGKNKLPMRELATLFTEAGGRSVETYIQSGNVLFDPAKADPAKIASRVHAAIEAQFGFRTPIVLRTLPELTAVVSGNPFDEASAEAALHVVFLQDTPGPGRVATLAPDRSPPDRFVVTGRDIYLHLPDGAARSKLTTAWFDSKLATVSTFRNWRTVNALLRLLQAESK